MGKTQHTHRAAVYARVSTEEQADGTSLDDQKQRGVDHVHHNQWELAGDFVDIGVSGATASRPGLDHVVRMAEDGQIDTVIITKLDRIARSLRHLLDLLELFERQQVTLVALDDPLDPSTASGKAMVHLRGVFAELERSLIRERMATGAKRRLEQGGWAGGTPPYGYRLVAAQHGRGSVLAIDDQEAATVKLVHRLITVEVMNFTQVAAELDRLGFKPRRARQWTPDNLAHMIKNARGLSGSWTYRRGDTPSTAGYEVTLQIPQILTVAEDDELKAAAASLATTPTKRRLYPLRNRVVSPHGQKMHGNRSDTRDGRIPIYKCRHRFSHIIRKEQTSRCDCHTIRAQMLEDAVWEEVVTLLGDGNLLADLARQRYAQRSEHAGKERERLTVLETQIGELESQIGDEYAAMRDEGFDAGAARAAVRGHNDKLVAVKQERQTLLRMRDKNLASTGLADRMRTLAQQAQNELRDADDRTRYNIIGLLDLSVQVTEWVPCAHCAATGFMKRTSPREARLPPTACPVCYTRGVVPAIRISGQVPELLLYATTDTDTVVPLGSQAAEGHMAVPFETSVDLARPA